MTELLRAEVDELTGAVLLLTARLEALEALLRRGILVDVCVNIHAGTPADCNAFDGRRLLYGAAAEVVATHGPACCCRLEPVDPRQIATEPTT